MTNNPQWKNGAVDITTIPSTDVTERLTEIMLSKSRDDAIKYERDRQLSFMKKNLKNRLKGKHAFTIFGIKEEKDDQV